MIKASDLRIGNKFYYWPIFNEMRLDTVICLRNKSKGYVPLLIKGKRSGWNQETQCHPITLTPEILTEWCGFEKNDERIYDNSFSIGDIIIHQEDGCFALFASEWTIGEPFKFLHELQNIVFFLFKKELEIKIPSLRTSHTNI